MYTLMTHILYMKYVYGTNIRAIVSWNKHNLTLDFSKEKE
jgi:hypothetical protein